MNNTVNSKAGTSPNVFIDFSKCMHFKGVEDSLMYLKTKSRDASNYLARGWEYVKELPEEKRRSREDDLVFQALVFNEMKRKFRISDVNDLEDVILHYKPQVMSIGAGRTSFSKEKLGAYGAYLLTLRNTEKVLSVCEIIQNYWKSGEDNKYLEYQAGKFLEVLQKKYEEADNKDELLKKAYMLFDLYSAQSSFWSIW